MKKISTEKIDRMIELNKIGAENIYIAAEVGVHPESVARYLRNYNLFSPRKRVIEMIDDKNAKCKMCSAIKPVTEFQIGRKGKPDEYKFAYCNVCRKNQTYRALNRSVEVRLKDKFNRLKIRAKKTNVDFNIDVEYFIQIFKLQKGRCFYTDIEMEWKVNRGTNPNSLSVDKIIPENGYTKGNIVFCCHRINTIKYNLSLNELEKWIPLWYNRIKTFLQKLP